MVAIGNKIWYNMGTMNRTGVRKADTKEYKMTELYIIKKGKNELGWQKGEGTLVKVSYNGRLLNGQIKFDLDRGENELYLYQRPSMICANYTRADKVRREMERIAPIVEDGEIVKVMIISEKMEIESHLEYQIKVNGDYSDCAILRRVA